jgi:hypothetical protein
MEDYIYTERQDNFDGTPLLQFRNNLFLAITHALMLMASITLTVVSLEP